MANYKQPNGLGVMSQQDVDSLVGSAKASYPFLNNTQFNATSTGTGGRDGAYLEAWQKGDAGDPSWPRDPRLPVSQAGIEIFRPDTKSSDIAADMLSHTDPYGQKLNAQLLHSLVPGQINELQGQSADFGQSLAMGMPYDAAMKNAGSSLFRAGVFNQWGDGGTDSMHLDPSQKNIINQGKGYSLSGKVPPKGLYDIRAALGMGSPRK